MIKKSWKEIWIQIIIKGKKIMKWNIFENRKKHLDNHVIDGVLQGQAGKVCAESLNGTDPEKAENLLRNLGQSICTVLEKKDMISKTSDNRFEWY